MHTDWYKGTQSKVRIVQRHGDLVTFECWYPMVIHPEVMTHRMFSRNAQSNRAMPMAKLREKTRKHIYIPIELKKNQPGMSAADDAVDAAETISAWMGAFWPAFVAHAKLEKIGLHKQWTNRILWPYQHIRVLISATEWDNFFDLRIADDAMPEIQELAILMKNAIDDTKDRVVGVYDQWHLPYITQEDTEYCRNEYGSARYDILGNISAARCARVSYDNLDNTKANPEKDIALAERLWYNQHMSPFEHIAHCTANFENDNWPDGVTHVDRRGVYWSGNFREPWIQFRQEL